MLAPVGAPEARWREGDVVEIQGEDETTPVKIDNSPETPTAKAMEEHRSCGHIPYRDWCKWCQMGRGIDTQHRSGNEPSAIPIVGPDYFYITGGGVKSRNELEQPNDAAGNAALNEERLAGTIVKCLLVRCTSTKAVFAHCVPAKGATEDQYVSSLIVSRVEWLGHTRLILKADNEPALRTLVEQSL